MVTLLRDHAPEAAFGASLQLAAASHPARGAFPGCSTMLAWPPDADKIGCARAAGARTRETRTGVLARRAAYREGAGPWFSI